MRRSLPFLCALAVAAFSAVGCVGSVDVEGVSRSSVRRACPSREAGAPRGFDHTTAPIGAARADEASDALGVLGGLVITTDAQLEVEPSTSNVSYRGYKRWRVGPGDAPAANELVSLWYFDAALGGYQPAGRARTDEHGAYAFVDTVATRPPDEPLFAVLEGDGSCSAHFDALYPSGTRVVVTEIDATLDRAGAATAMRAWREKGYPVVYLSRALDRERADTRAWLDAHDFPTGALITQHEGGLGLLAYKTTWLTRMIARFGWAIEAAYGEDAADVHAYAAAGVDASHVFAVGASIDGAQRVADFDAHSADFIGQAPDQAVE